ncbi:hypothetical protein HYE82_23125 [Streptomyces sp. BR123]|uniref:hypothetical protein n=1 Tax=Streptomyces sp. BR123 TaxID=2749828 RepID=UPI0015C4DD4A|nr:hypothetical protein [Streptomyces sp. BR123]NXY97214.1 hypothetical protein [Streptomyces sp. BR123]
MSTSGGAEDPDGGRVPEGRPWASSHPRSGGAPAGSGGMMPPPVKNLRVLLMVLGGVQAVVGLGLVTNSVAVATAVWGEGDASTPCCTTPGEAHAGIIVLAGLLVPALAAWGIVTALKFPTRQAVVRVSTAACGWTALPFTWVLHQLVPIPALGVAWLVPAILALVRVKQSESWAWFSARD